MQREVHMMLAFQWGELGAMWRLFWLNHFDLMHLRWSIARLLSAQHVLLVFCSHVPRVSSHQKRLAVISLPLKLWLFCFTDHVLKVHC